MQPDHELHAQLTAERDKLREEVAFLKEQEVDYHRIQKELHLRQSEINALLNIAPHPVLARFDRSLRHTYIYSAVDLATAIPPKDYIGRTSREMGMPEPSITLLENAMELVFSKGAEKVIEYPVIMPNRKFTYETRIIPEFNHTHSVEQVLVITRDITRIKRAETALLENYQILETIHNVGKVLSAELDQQKLLQVVTDTATELSRAEIGAFFYNVLNDKGESYMLYTISGVSPKAFANYPMPRNTDVFGPTFRGEGTIRMDDVHADPRYGKNDPHHGMPKGHFPVRSYLAVPVISQSGEVLGGLFFGHSEVGVFTERDERVIEGLAAQAAITLDNSRLYREAEDQRKRLQTTLASIGDAVIATDPEGSITFMNGVAQRLTGWTEAEALGKPLDDVFRIVNETSRQTVESPVAKVIREGAVVGLANHTLLLARDGRETPIDDSGAPIFNDEQVLLGVILVFRDITERRQHDQRLNLLLELSAAFSQALTTNQIAEVIVGRALKALEANVGTVSLLVEDDTQLEMLNLHGLSKEIIEKYRRTPIALSSPVNTAVQTGQLLWIETFEDYVTRYPHFTDAIKRNGSQSTICVPLRINEKIIGAFSLSFPVEKRRNTDEEAFFVALAQLCAQSLERARLYELERQSRPSGDNT